MTDTPGNGQDREKKRRPAHLKVADRPTRWLPGVRGLTPAVLLPTATAWAASPAVGRPGAPASIPKRPGRAARFTGAGAASQLGRGPASRTARRGATSAWARHATGLACSRGVITRIVGRPKPLYASASSPEFPSRATTQGVAETSEVPTLPLSSIDQSRRSTTSRKCRYFFGLRHFMWLICGSWLRDLAGLLPPFPLDVELCKNTDHMIHIVSRAPRAGRLWRSAGPRRCAER